MQYVHGTEGTIYSQDFSHTYMLLWNMTASESGDGATTSPELITTQNLVVTVHHVVAQVTPGANVR